MRMLIVGAGAIGGIYGGRLARAGRDVTFLLRPKRAETIAADGLSIVSPHGDFTVRPKIVTADKIEAPYDAVLLTVKSFSLDAAMADMAPAIGPETMILAPLNGMRHVETLTAKFGASHLVGCVCRIAVDLDADGRIHQLHPTEDIAYGEMDGQETPRLQALDAFMKDCGFPTRSTPAIAAELWDKWIFLGGLGAITCLMRGTIGAVMAAPGGRDFALGLIDEIVAVVGAAGTLPNAARLAELRATLTKEGSPLASSMYRDLQKGQPVEADAIIGDLLARGQRTGVATPLLAAVYAHLCVYQASLTKK